MDPLQCMNDSDAKVQQIQGEVYCNSEFDELICWHAALANSTISMRCPIPVDLPDYAVAYKTCYADGNWSRTDYNACFPFIPTDNPISGRHPPPDEYESHIARIMTDIYFVFSIISLLFLLISIFIFIYFRSLHCHRITIHIHMFISFVIKFVIIIVMVEPGVTKRSSGTYKDIEWLCKTLIALREYGNTSNMYWMFVEGMYLHNQIAAAVFSTEAPFKLFCFIGWGVPGIIVLAWSIIMQCTSDKPCWNYYSQSDWIYLVLVPFLVVIFINLIFLVNIIRILVTKLRSNNTDESSRIKKTIRATIILFPLLGLTNIIFLYNPEDRGSLQLTYHITNALLQSTGGILLSVLYCFMNGEVQRVIKQKWTRFNIRRHLKRGGKSRSSRTSDFMLSQTEFHRRKKQSQLYGTPSSDMINPFVNNNRYHKVETSIPEEDIVVNYNSDEQCVTLNHLNKENAYPIGSDEQCVSINQVHTVTINQGDSDEHCITLDDVITANHVDSNEQHVRVPLNNIDNDIAIHNDSDNHTRNENKNNMKCDKNNSISTKSENHVIDEMNIQVRSDGKIYIDNEETTYILPSAESFDNIEESFI
ncbi:corticotropin-releasing factor receptor 2-like isoform X2 [Mytilus californianus]|uniref:corticotropin-releasing factor receptor 2-like isoform X2 n=1 Tax=Mytilus californianus TaxID=6549 RepID=UPI00224573B2|nr:corticotropin-releasing factor receptor 2-like isoform X2 [Mytilus californianus]